MTNISPYSDCDSGQWHNITQQLIAQHPLHVNEIVNFVTQSWNIILNANIGPLRYGKEIFPTPQATGNNLHDLIPYLIQAQYPETWRIGQPAIDKDIVYIPNNQFSIELKTSSDAKHIFGNRSYAQESSTNKKSRAGYFLTVNFEKFTPENPAPQIVKIGFGWLDTSDWIPQRAPTGQQARLSAETYKHKIIQIYPAT